MLHHLLRSFATLHLAGRPDGWTCLPTRQALQLLRANIVVMATLTTLSSHAQGPDLIGYWHNWNDASAPYLELSQVDERYTAIYVSFALTVPDLTRASTLVLFPTRVVGSITGWKLLRAAPSPADPALLRSHGS